MKVSNSQGIRPPNNINSPIPQSGFTGFPVGPFGFDPAANGGLGGVQDSKGKEVKEWLFWNTEHG